MPSDGFAASVNTSPAFIRQVLTQLRKAGLVRSRLGKGGGTMLARSADLIRLDEVYRATSTLPMVALHRSKPNQDCPVGRSIQPLLSQVLERAEEALLNELRGVTVADLAAGVHP